MEATVIRLEAIATINYRRFPANRFTGGAAWLDLRNTLLHSMLMRVRGSSLVWSDLTFIECPNGELGGEIGLWVLTEELPLEASGSWAESYAKRVTMFLELINMSCYAGLEVVVMFREVLPLMSISGLCRALGRQPSAHHSSWSSLTFSCLS